MIKRSIDFKKEGEDNEGALSEKVEVTCNCTKSNCTKKYCECYKAGEGCKDSCRCINCSNNKQLKPAKKKVTSKCSPDDYIIEGISVYINNEHVSISYSKNLPKSDKKINKIFEVKQTETPKLIKKRNRVNKTEETNKSKSTNITNTPLFTTSQNEQKTRKIEFGENNKIIKNLDKIY
jgi:hypothetical protein